MRALRPALAALGAPAPAPPASDPGDHDLVAPQGPRPARPARERARWCSAPAAGRRARDRRRLLRGADQARPTRVWSRWSPRSWPTTPSTRRSSARCCTPETLPARRPRLVTGPRARQPADAIEPLLASAAMRIAVRSTTQMVTHARADAPNECCGMIASRDGEAVHASTGPRTPRPARCAMRSTGPSSTGSRWRSMTRGSTWARSTTPTPAAPLSLADRHQPRLLSRGLYVIVGLAGERARGSRVRDPRRQVADAELEVVR